MSAVTGLRRRLSLVPLRIKLVLTMLMLVAVGLFGAGALATSLLSNYLLQRVDATLQDVVAGGRLPLPAPEAQNGNSESGRRSLNRFYVEGTSPVTGTVVYRRTGSPPPRLPDLTSTNAQFQAQEPFTVSAVSGQGQWRVLAVATFQRGVPGVVVFAAELDDVQAIVQRLLLTEVAAGLVVLVLLGVAAYALLRRSLRPLREVEQTAAAIAGGDLSLRVPRQDSVTEVGRLATGFNLMLNRLEASFDAQRRSEADARAAELQARTAQARAVDAERSARTSEARVRQFVADASHELRTPLTSIRGFAELYRHGAVRSGVDLDRVMTRVEAEASRMGALVEEMLLLARLDQHRGLEATVVDLTALADDAVHDAQARDLDRPIDLELDLDQPALVLGDDARLRQVLNNLLSNALVHTPPGSPVQVSVRTRGQQGQAILEVTDCGPGLTKAEQAHVFERFYRADSARTRATGGSGLGLSIVQAIVSAHEGQVALQSTPGEGTTFRVSMPLLELE